jgi:hypothetical protein
MGQAADESVEQSVGQLSRGRVDPTEGANSARLLFGGAHLDAVQPVEWRAISRQLGGTAVARIPAAFGGSDGERDPVPIPRRICPRLGHVNYKLSEEHLMARFKVVMA